MQKHFRCSVQVVARHSSWLGQALGEFHRQHFSRIDSGEDFETYSPILEMICQTYNPGWLLVAQWHMETGTADSFEKAKTSLRRYLESGPSAAEASEAWRMLANAYAKTGDALGEVHASIERAQISSVPFYDLSNTANRLNQLLSKNVLDMDREEKRQLAQRIVSVLDRRRSEADASDFSRMAWLAMQIGQEGTARDYVKLGLEMDAENYHCLSLAERLRKSD